MCINGESECHWYHSFPCNHGTCFGHALSYEPEYNSSCSLPFATKSGLFGKKLLSANSEEGYTQVDLRTQHTCPVESHKEWEHLSL